MIRRFVLAALLMLSSLFLMAREPIGAEPAAKDTVRGFAVVNFSANYMRESPDYTAENGTQALMGTVVKVIGSQSYWRRIITPDGYKAWTTARGLVPMNTSAVKDYLSSDRYICVVPYTHAYAEPSRDSGFICDLVAGDILRQGRKQKKGGFLGVVLPDGREAWVPKGELEDLAHWAKAAEASPENIEATARLFLGVPYFWGGTSIKGVDCSGLVSNVFFLNGIILPRNASQQACIGEEVPLETEQGSLNFEAFRKGDLIFFGNGSRASHVGIYLGDGWMIHSSEVVRINTIRDADSPDYYSRRPIAVRRIIGHEGESGITPVTSSSSYFLAR